MLEELQRLQAHISVLKKRLAQFESENNALNDQKNSSDEQHHAQIVHKNGIITSKQEEIETLNEQLTDSTCSTSTAEY